MNKNLDWSVPNHRLYSEAFTGRAQSIPRWQVHVCLSDTHPTHQCPFQPNPIRGLQLDERSTADPTSPQSSPAGSTQVCRYHNKNCYTYPKCRYIHVCIECSYPHPYVKCPRNPANQSSRLAGRSQFPTWQPRALQCPPGHPGFPN